MTSEKATRQELEQQIAELLRENEELHDHILQQQHNHQASNAILAIEIAERRQAEIDLQENKEWLSQIVERNSIPTFVIDRHHIITHWNKALENLTGFKSSEMIGTKNQWKAFYLAVRPTMADLTVDRAKEDVVDSFYNNKYRKSTLLDNAYEAEDFFDFGGNKTKWLFFTAAPIRNQAGDIIGAIETLQDITTRKEMEQEIRDSHEKLEKRVEERTFQLKKTYDQLLHAEKLSAVGKLAASIAHEFGNPIIGIRNFLKSLRKIARLEKTDGEMLELAIQECHRIKDLISNLQDFNRPTSGRVTAMDLHEAIDNMLLFCKKKFKDKRIEVIRDYDPEMVPVMAVNDQIKQVILNCLNNAEEAIPESGGTIKLITRVVADAIELRICDSGKGIKGNDVYQIFDPFFSTKPAVEGTGLGLSVSYGIVKRHHGNIEVLKTSSRGTTFQITLPINGTPVDDAAV